MATAPQSKRPLGGRPSIFNIESPSSSRKRKRPISLLSDTRQMVLDAGQRRLGAQHCSECGMVYSVDCQQDMKEHEKHHNNKSEELFKMAKRRVEDFEKVNPGRMWNIDSKSFIKRQCAILTSCCKRTFFLNRILRIIEDVVNVELGFPPDISVWGEDNRCSVLVMLEKKDEYYTIVSILVRETIKQAYWNDSEEVVENQAILGVNRIWTHPSWRKQGLAKILINFDFNRSSSCKSIAFTDLTEEGKQLAEKISGANRYLLYSVRK